MYRYNSTFTFLQNQEKHFCISYLPRLLQFLQEIGKSPAPILQHPRPARDLADRNIQFSCNIPLRRALIKLLNELPALRDGRQFLRRENIAKELLGLLLVLHGTEELVEIP